jgi:hypothetical protein
MNAGFRSELKVNKHAGDCGYDRSRSAINDSAPEVHSSWQCLVWILEIKGDLLLDAMSVCEVFDLRRDVEMG